MSKILLYKVENNLLTTEGLCLYFENHKGVYGKVLNHKGVIWKSLKPYNVRLL